MRRLILVVLVGSCLMETYAGRINTNTVRGFKDGKRYLKNGQKIIMTEMQECRVFCIKKYYNCYEKNQCALKKNEHRVKYCRKLYTDCMAYCKYMIRRMEIDDFPPFLVDDRK